LSIRSRGRLTKGESISRPNQVKRFSLEEEQLALFRNLRFKHFLIAFIAKSLETIVDRKVDREAIVFTPDAARASQNNLLDLVAAWTPVVEAVLSFLATKVSAAEFSTKLTDETLLDDVAKHVSALLYAGKASIQFADFSKLVAES